MANDSHVPQPTAEAAATRFSHTCQQCGGTHEAPCEPSPADGLVIVDRLRVWCPIAERASGEGWNLTHLVSGLTIPRVFDDGDEAEACADALAGLWDWTRNEVPAGDALDRVHDVLRDHGWPSAGEPHKGELPALNSGSVSVPETDT
jgi:hypothetical protein